MYHKQLMDGRYFIWPLKWKTWYLTKLPSICVSEHLLFYYRFQCDLESQVYGKLSTMLQCMEAHNQSVDVDRVNDLIKVNVLRFAGMWWEILTLTFQQGNMQRSKIVTDGITDARSQILKIFDHKNPVSDIISRCASKRNFKKREKT